MGAHPSPLPALEVLRSWVAVDGTQQSGLRALRHGVTFRFASSGYWMVRFVGSKRMLTAHRVVFALARGRDPHPLLVDHVDRDPLNNAAENLREATHRENSTNSRSRKGSSSAFIGVSWSRQRDLWRADIQVNGHSICVGFFGVERDAAVAYDVVALNLHGEFAKPNFPTPAQEQSA